MIAAAIAQFLDDLGIGIYRPNDVGGNIFIAKIPDEPDNLIYLAEVPSIRPSGVHPYSETTVQAICRGTARNPVPPYEVAREIYGALHGFNTDTIGSFYVVGCLSQTGGPVSMGRDDNDRYEWSLNLDIEFMDVTAHRLAYS